MGKTESPSGHAVCLAEAIEDQDFIVRPRRAGKRLVVTKDAIDLVAEQQNATFLRQKGEFLQAAMSI
jgi:hypothetical protein